jgi:hypothetical protein
MRSKLAIMLVGVIMFAVGLLSGGAIQNAKTGYHYKLLDQKEYPSAALGPIEWSCFIESVGTPFLDTEKTMINMGNRTLYKAQRDFQENDPHARNIEISDNVISWDDGDFQYHLTVVPMKNDKTAVK